MGIRRGDYCSDEEYEQALKDETLIFNITSQRKNPCPKCDIGKLKSVGYIFFTLLECDNPICDYECDNSDGYDPC